MVWALGSGLITWEQEDATLLDTDCNWLNLRKVDTNDSGSFHLFWWSVFQGIGLVSGMPANLPWFLKFCYPFELDWSILCLNSLPLSHLLVIESLFQGISLVLGIPVNLPWFSELCCSLNWTDQFSVLLELCVLTPSTCFELLLEDSSSCLRIDHCVLPRTARG